MKQFFTFLLCIALSSAAYAEDPVQKERQKGQPEDSHCDDDSDCQKYGESYYCNMQPYACGKSATCMKHFCAPRPAQNEAARSATSERATKRAFKGYELYSWTDGIDWKFSLLSGTNRNKTPEEILRPRAPITGVQKLKDSLSKLAVGESVFWFNDGAEGLTYPPKETVAELKRFAAEKGVKLGVGLDQTLENKSFRVVPYFRSGRTIGLRLFAIRTGSVAQEKGLLNGDIIRSINGTQFVDSQSKSKLVALLTQPIKIDALVERNGKQENIIWEPKASTK